MNDKCYCGVPMIWLKPFHKKKRHECVYHDAHKCDLCIELFKALAAVFERKDK